MLLFKNLKHYVVRFHQKASVFTLLGGDGESVGVGSEFVAGNLIFITSNNVRIQTLRQPIKEE